MMSLKRYLINLLLMVLPPTRAFGFKRFLWRHAGVSVAADAKINSGVKLWGGGPVSVGPGSWLGLNLVIIVPHGVHVAIGANVDIGPDVLIECGSHRIGGPERRAGEGEAASVDIGAGCWIGCRATLLGGVNLAPGTLVAAGALVLPGTYPENALLAGVPARVARILDQSDVQS